jgi:hypothetical protein
VNEDDLYLDARAVLLIEHLRQPGKTQRFCIRAVETALEHLEDNSPGRCTRSGWVDMLFAREREKCSLTYARLSNSVKLYVLPAVYTVRFSRAVFVLHVFQKKSKSGIATPKQVLEVIRDRLKIAKRLAEEK